MLSQTQIDFYHENGPLMIIPGSHKSRLHSHHQDGIFVGAVTDADFDMATASPIELKAGGISIHHARVLHASAPNTSDRARRLLLFQYCAADSWPIMGMDWDAYAESFIRGEAVNRPRMADIPMLLPLPKSERGGSIYEIQTQLAKKAMAGMQ